MASAPALWLCAGPNGAGKTTFLQRGDPFSAVIGLPAPLMLNPDQRCQQVLRRLGYTSGAAPRDVQKQAFLAAAEEIEQEALAALRAGHRVCVETVLSTRKYDVLVDEVHRLGGQFHLIYVGLRSAALSATRVQRRVAKGGHDVPAEKIPLRWQRSVNNLAHFAARADSVVVFDNSDSDANAKVRRIARGARVQTNELHLVIEEPELIPEITAVLRPLMAAK